MILAIAIVTINNNNNILIIIIIVIIILLILIIIIRMDYIGKFMQFLSISTGGCGLVPRSCDFETFIQQFSVFV
jgi:hypothetical protein